jgi:hypothetical protein
MYETEFPSLMECTSILFMYMLGLGMFWKIDSVLESPGNLTARSLTKKTTVW